MNDRKVLEIIEHAEGIWGVVVKQIGRDIAFAYNADVEFPAASVGKVAIALYIFHLVETGAADLMQTFEIGREDYSPGTGILQFLAHDSKFLLEDLIKLMLIVSDNVAAKFLVRLFGVAHINQYLKSLGFTKTQLGIQGTKFDFGSTTPREISLLLEGIYTNAFLNKHSSDALIGIMKKCENQMSIRRYLPRETSSGQKLEVAHKGGALDDVRHDVGIVFAKDPYVISVLSKALTDHSYQPDNAGILTIARLSKEIYAQLG